MMLESMPDDVVHALRRDWPSFVRHADPVDNRLGPTDCSGFAMNKVFQPQSQRAAYLTLKYTL
jgi:hypothetical protein